MKQPDIETIEAFSKRSDRAVIWITVAFAVGGAVFDIGAHLLSSLFTNGGMSMLWGMWIPFCFITIPPIHYLCRRVAILQKQIDDLESRLERKAAA